MPNWCWNNITVWSEHGEIIDAIYNKINFSMEHPIVTTSWTHDGRDNSIINAVLALCDVVDESEIPERIGSNRRGSIEMIKKDTMIGERSYYYINFYLDSAWSPSDGFIDAIKYYTEQFYSGDDLCPPWGAVWSDYIHIFGIFEESGEGYYGIMISNEDERVFGKQPRICLSTDNLVLGELDGEGFKDEEELKEMIIKCLKTNRKQLEGSMLKLIEADIDKIYKFLEDNEVFDTNNEFLSINKYENV